MIVMITMDIQGPKMTSISSLVSCFGQVLSDRAGCGRLPFDAPPLDKNRTDHADAGKNETDLKGFDNGIIVCDEYDRQMLRIDKPTEASGTGADNDSRVEAFNPQLGDIRNQECKGLEGTDLMTYRRTMSASYSQVHSCCFQKNPRKRRPIQREHRYA